MTKHSCFGALLMCVLFCNNIAAQVSENFSDGNYTQNPVWNATAGDWIVNPAFQLQSNSTTLNSSFYISTASTLATLAQWEFTVNLPFNTSSANYVDVYLMASQGNLLTSGVTGYFVRIGNSDDEVSLYRKDAPTTPVRIIDGTNGITNTPNNTLRIKVVRAAGNSFTLFRDVTGTGNNYVSEGTIPDATYTTSGFFGFVVRQSTASFVQRHFFDDILVQAYSPDVTPPIVQSVTAPTPNSIEVLFNEPVETASAQTLANYSVSNSIGIPVTATKDASNAALVRLTFAGTFANGVSHTLTVNGVKDLAGNAASNTTGTFSFFVPQRFDVVIDEIMADPTPVVQLPDAEYIELRNTTTQNINLQGWRIGSGTSVSGPLPSYILPADGVVIITGTSSATLFSSYGPVLSVTSFPSLNNTGALLALISKDNQSIHAVEYDVAWYQNPIKSNGGWSLEMIDVKNPCNGASNWKASTDLSGGTPGRKNSVDGANPDRTAPTLLSAVATDPLRLLLTFSEALDSSNAAIASKYTISDGIGSAVSASPVGPLFKQVSLQLTTALAVSRIYTVTVTDVADCSGNLVQANRTAKVGLPAAIDSMDVVINEVLFNPAPTTVDYVEIYNRSTKILDLKELYITNRSSTTNQLGTPRQLSLSTQLLFPGEYYVISEDDALVKQAYMVKSPDYFINVSPMPSYPDTKGVVVLLNAQGRVVDELQYDDGWHFALLDNEEGISLERIDYNKPTQSKENWHSASSTAGYGTPSYQNSQYRLDAQLPGVVTISPKIFSPDNDGTDDFATVQYQMTEPGFVANITIFDAAGRPVKNLAKNATLGLSGSFRWDGLDDKLNKLAIGTYIIYTEVFNLNGKKNSFKKTIVLARRF